MIAHNLPNQAGKINFVYHRVGNVEFSSIPSRFSFLRFAMKCPSCNETATSFLRNAFLCRVFPRLNQQKGSSSATRIGAFRIRYCLAFQALNNKWKTKGSSPQSSISNLQSTIFNLQCSVDLTTPQNDFVRREGPGFVARRLRRASQPPGVTHSFGGSRSRRGKIAENLCLSMFC